MWVDVDCTDIYALKLSSMMRQHRPIGFCVDIGAPRSVVGVKELHRITSKLGLRNVKRRKSYNRFRFADTTFESLGQVDLPLDTPSHVKPVYVTLDIVRADVPALLGMDLLDRESLTPDTVANRLSKRVAVKGAKGEQVYLEEWSAPLVRSASNHVYVGIRSCPGLHFARSQLVKLHRHFFHPSAEKLFNLLKRARPDEASPGTLELLQDISKRCDPCQRIQNAPTRFKVAFGADNVRFNERLLLDIMYIDGKPILHIVDEGTRFSAARFLPDVSTKTVWNALLECWALIYTGLPNRMLVDQGTSFGKSESGGLFVELAALENVEVEKTGVEAHSSLGLGERYHQPLRQTYRKIMSAHPNTSPNHALASAVKAMNDTLGPEGLVPAMLVFGEYPRVSTRSEKNSARKTLRQRSGLAETARKEMEQHMARMRLSRALKQAVPSAADEIYELGEKVLVWREKIVDNRIGEWIGPFKVVDFDASRKLVFVRDADVGPARPFNATQVKHYRDPEVVAHTFISSLDKSLAYYRTPAEDEEVYLTEIIDASDDRALTKEMSNAKKAEIRSLLERGTFKVLLKEDVPSDANILPGRFVLAIKSTDDNKIKYKARYVVGGHRDRYKHMMVHSSTTLQPQSVRLLLALAAMFGFDVWTSDVRQAYLQSAEPLSREIFIKSPVEEFELDPSQCLQLLKPLYGLCESGDLWHRTLDRHHREDLGMKPLRSDPALYTLIADGVLRGLSGGYVDDLIRAGDDFFKEVSKKTSEKFEMASDESLPCTFTGFSLSRDKGGQMQQDQHSYLRKLEQLPIDASFSQFRSMRMKLAWLSNTRPDCLLEISQLAQITETKFSNNRRDIIKRLNRAVKYAVDHRFSLRIPRLDLQSLRVIGFSDASFANNEDLTSQLGHICFLADDSNNAVPVSFKSYKAKRVTRSVMAGEVIAFSDLFDVAFTLAEELKGMLGRSVPVQLLTDSKSLFDVISKGSRTSERRMMIDIAAAREAFRDKVISNIGFVRSSHNIADGLTKAMSQSALRSVVSTGKLHVSPEQWIVRG